MLLAADLLKAGSRLNNIYSDFEIITPLAVGDAEF